MEKALKKHAPIFVLPTFLAFVIGFIIPFAQGFYLSFCKFTTVGNATFVGISNYTAAIKDTSFTSSFKFTVLFAIVSILLINVLAFGLALLVRENIKGIGIFRSAYFSPLVTSMSVIAILWTFIYNPNPTQGLLNAILTKFGLPACDFLRSADTAMNSIIFMSAWQGAGYQMMIFLAGLQGIPKDQYEAASVDGANKWNQFLFITLPGLKGTIKYVIMITMIQAMKLFTQPYIMTQGGPKNSTKTLVYYIYTQGFQKGNFGYACSIATVFFVIVVAMSLLMKKVTTATD